MFAVTNPWPYETEKLFAEAIKLFKLFDGPRSNNFTLLSESVVKINWNPTFFAWTFEMQSTISSQRVDVSLILQPVKQIWMMKKLITT